MGPIDLAGTSNLLNLFVDSNRLRLMSLVADVELTVAEMTHITGLSQSRVSTHLGKLRDAGLLRDRRVRSSTYYKVNAAGMDEAAQRVWNVIRSQLEDAVLAGDLQRREQTIQARDSGQSWPDAVAGTMERHYSPGRTWEATARGFLGLVRLGDVIDVGSGDGVIAQLLAPRARSLTCLDRSEKVLAAAQQRLVGMSNVRLIQGDMHDVPFGDQSFDHAVLFNVLTYAHHPDRVLASVHRVLRDGGDVTVVTLREHQHMDLAMSYEHVNAGFTPPGLTRVLESAGFRVQSCAVTSRERRKPYFEVLSAFATRN